MKLRTGETEVVVLLQSLRGIWFFLPIPDLGQLGMDGLGG